MPFWQLDFFLKIHIKIVTAPKPFTAAMELNGTVLVRHEGFTNVVRMEIIYRIGDYCHRAQLLFKAIRNIYAKLKIRAMSK